MAAPGSLTNYNSDSSSGSFTRTLYTDINDGLDVLEDALYSFSEDLKSTIKVLKWSYLTQAAGASTETETETVSSSSSGPSSGPEEEEEEEEDPVPQLDFATDTFLRLVSRWQDQIRADFFPAARQIITQLRAMTPDELAKTPTDQLETLLERSEKAEECLLCWRTGLRSLSRAYLQGLDPHKLTLLHLACRSKARECGYADVVEPFLEAKRQREGGAAAEATEVKVVQW